MITGYNVYQVPMSLSSLDWTKDFIVTLKFGR